jgi:hypothetical protein
VVVAVEIQDAQTAKEAFGSDAVAGSVGDADATHTARIAVVKVSKSLKQIFSKGPNFAAIEQSGQDQGRVLVPLDFFSEVLITKEFFKAPNAAVAGFGCRGTKSSCIPWWHCVHKAAYFIFPAAKLPS